MVAIGRLLRHIFVMRLHRVFPNSLDCLPDEEPVVTTLHAFRLHIFLIFFLLRRYKNATLEDLQVGMYKVLNKVLAHEDAWPFIEPVDEEVAPDYYQIVEKPMTLQWMEDKLDRGKYDNIEEFKNDFHLILTNCKQYNGSRNGKCRSLFHLNQLQEAEMEFYIHSS